MKTGRPLRKEAAAPPPVGFGACLRSPPARQSGRSGVGELETTSRGSPPTAPSLRKGRRVGQAGFSPGARARRRAPVEHRGLGGPKKPRCRRERMNLKPRRARTPRAGLCGGRLSGPRGRGSAPLRRRASFRRRRRSERGVPRRERAVVPLQHAERRGEAGDEQREKEQRGSGVVSMRHGWAFRLRGKSAGADQRFGGRRRSTPSTKSATLA